MPRPLFISIDGNGLHVYVVFGFTYLRSFSTCSFQILLSEISVVSLAFQLRVGSCSAATRETNAHTTRHTAHGAHVVHDGRRRTGHG